MYSKRNKTTPNNHVASKIRVIFKFKEPYRYKEIFKHCLAQLKAWSFKSRAQAPLVKTMLNGCTLLYTFKSPKNYNEPNSSPQA